MPDATSSRVVATTDNAERLGFTISTNLAGRGLISPDRLRLPDGLFSENTRLQPRIEVLVTFDVLADGMVRLHSAPNSGYPELDRAIDGLFRRGPVFVAAAAGSPRVSGEITFVIVTTSM